MSHKPVHVRAASTCNRLRPRSRLTSMPALAVTLWLLVSLCASGCHRGPDPVHRGQNFTAADSPVYEVNDRPEGPLASDTLLVVTFNIQFGREIDRAIAELESPDLAGADIVLLQEMDSAGTDRIARALGDNYLYYPASIHVRTGREFGDAVLVRGRILDRAKIILPHLDPNHLQRIASYARIELIRRDGRKALLDVYSAHLGTRIGTRARRDQVEEIAQRAAGDSIPCIIGGDFNIYDRAQFKGLAPLQNAGFRDDTSRIPWSSRVALFGRTVYGMRLDHIFSHGLAVVGAARAAEQVSASDHWPVWARVVLPAPL